jgi:hypothetical protein
VTNEDRSAGKKFLVLSDGSECILSPSDRKSKREVSMNIKNIMALAAIGTFLFIAPAKAATEVFSATLLGDNEVPPVNSNGTATFHMENPDGVITFSFTFSGLSSNLVVSPLHFAPTKVAGAVMIFLCGGGAPPACPAATTGTITGTIVAANCHGAGGPRQ